MTRAYLGLGANVGGRGANLARAAHFLSGVAGLRLLRRSSIWETEPWGDPWQPAYLNAALAVTTELGPEALLARCLAVEAALGRRRGLRRGARLIDIDVLLFGDLQRAFPHPILPHPELHRRAFALRPLVDLDPELVVPGRGRVADLLEGLDVRGIRRWKGGGSW